MPYIKLEDRSQFAGPIQETLSILNNGPESQYIKGEYFGFWLNRLACKWLGQEERQYNTSFNSIHFNDTKKKTLVSTADSLSVLVNRSDPINSAGNLNYCISAVLWGFMGAAAGSTAANYGMRAYLKGIVEAVLQNLSAPTTGSQSDVTQAFRRNLIVRGVLSDVVDEAYRRDTAVYENHKKIQNGDIWASGSLVLPEGE